MSLFCFKCHLCMISFFFFAHIRKSEELIIQVSNLCFSYKIGQSFHADSFDDRSNVMAMNDPNIIASDRNVLEFTFI